MGAGLTTTTTRGRRFPSGLTLVLFNSSGGIGTLSRPCPASLRPPARPEAGGSVTAPHSGHPRPGPLCSLLALAGRDRGPPCSRPRPPPASFPTPGGRWGAAPGPRPGPEPGRAWRGAGRSGRWGGGVWWVPCAGRSGVAPSGGAAGEGELWRAVPWKWIFRGRLKLLLHREPCQSAACWCAPAPGITLLSVPGTKRSDFQRESLFPIG